MRLHDEDAAVASRLSSWTHDEVIAWAKQSIRPGADWARCGEAENSKTEHGSEEWFLEASDVRDTLERVPYDRVTNEEWLREYAGRPQVIAGATAGWPAEGWTFESLASKWGEAQF